MSHLVLGANPLGRSVLAALADLGHDATGVSIMGDPAYDVAGATGSIVDGADADAVEEVCRGADAIYLLLNAHYVDWYHLFPPRLEAARCIERKIPNFEVLNDEALEIIEANAEIVLEEIGISFVENPGALERWRAAGADVRGDRVHLPRGLARKLCATAPSSYTQIARNRERQEALVGSQRTFTRQLRAAARLEIRRQRIRRVRKSN